MADELEKKQGAEDAVVKQVVLRARALSGRIENGHHERLEPEKRIQLLMEAIRCTIPRFDLEEIGQSLLGLNEMKIILNIANAFANMRNERMWLKLYPLLHTITQNISIKMAGMKRLWKLRKKGSCAVLNMEAHACLENYSPIRRVR